MAQRDWLLPVLALAGLGGLFVAMKGKDEDEDGDKKEPGPDVKAEWAEELGEDEPEKSIIKDGVPMLGFDPFNPWGWFGITPPDEPDEIPAGEPVPPHGIERQWPKRGNPPKPMLVGMHDDPDVAAVLQELDDYLAGYGVGEYTSARELTTMPKAPGQPVAIPPYRLWPNIISTLQVWQPIREKLGFPMNLRAYRPPDYNEAVGGAPTSAHMWFSSLEIRPAVYTNENRRNLGLEGARAYVEQGDELGMGFGAYGRTPTNIHLDTHRSSKHTWKNGPYFIDKV